MLTPQNEKKRQEGAKYSGWNMSRKKEKKQKRQESEEMLGRMLVLDRERIGIVSMRGKRD
jgi:hypothetical protein